MIKTVLFDLDGTLLPMDQDQFTNAYFTRLAAFMAARGHDPKTFLRGVKTGLAAMVKNDGTATNEQAFWRSFASVCTETGTGDKALFDRFYREEFAGAKEVCGFDPAAGALIRRLKREGYRLVLASNPVFPAVAQRARMEWAGVDPADFHRITSYENSRYCKPNPAYYREIALLLDLDPAECVMVGNDLREDTAALQAGMKAFICTPCLIEREGEELSRYPHGRLEDLPDFLQGMKNTS